VNVKEKQLIKGTYFGVKRLLDIIISSILFVLFSPIILLVGVLIFLIDGRPILFLQQRTGQFNQEFTIIKFRTMERGGGEDEHNYAWIGKVPQDFMFKTPDHLKVTKLGAMLRKCSLDELLQLINVIKGDMNLVGPRPEIPNITKFYDKFQQQRLLVKPGITGYAQVHGRSDITHGLKINYDLYYVEHISFLLDLKIICKTVTQVFLGKGAY
jgi:lipopolysaccharide/colanic/teichoic acid biosynthesis glycosyltransferase